MKNYDITFSGVVSVDAETDEEAITKAKEDYWKQDNIEFVITECEEAKND
jgi:hypothetical protein